MGHVGFLAVARNINPPFTYRIHVRGEEGLLVNIDQQRTYSLVIRKISEGVISGQTLTSM